MNDWSATHYCSGSESGWTMYLDNSYTSDHRFNGGSGGGENYKAKEAKARTEEEEDEEEDLSMVSDASSGPPHYIEDNEELFYNNGYSSYAISASELERKKSKKGKQNGRNQQHSYLDDTASSPVYGYTKANVKEQKINTAKSNKALEENPVDFSQGFSATHFKRKSALRKHLGFYSSEKSAPEE